MLSILWLTERCSSRAARSIIKNLIFGVDSVIASRKRGLSCVDLKRHRRRGLVNVVRRNGVILQTRLTSAGTRVYFYRTSLFGMGRGNKSMEEIRSMIAVNAQWSFSKADRSFREDSARHQSQRC
jgi:hypothetical protein